MVDIEKRAARKLSPRDESDLSWFHTLGPGDVSALKAQSYDATGGGDCNDNDPLILRRLSPRAIAHAARFRVVEGVRMEVMRAPEGQTFVAWLGIAYADPQPGDPHSMFPEHPISGRVLWRNANPHPAASLARHTPSAQERGREDVESEEHERVVRLAYESALEARRDAALGGVEASQLSLVESVLRRDGSPPPRAARDVVDRYASRAIERASRGKRRDDAFCRRVRDEAMAMWSAAGSAFAEARSRMPQRKTAEQVVREERARRHGRSVVRDMSPREAAELLADTASWV